MYPLNMTIKAGGYAVANDAAEHQSLSEQGYEPGYVAPAAPEAPARSIEGVRAELDAAGIAYDKRWGIDKLLEQLPE